MPLEGCSKVINEYGKRRLTATSHNDESQREIRDSFLLMPICIGQDTADIPAKASVRSSFVGRGTDASRVTGA